MTRGQGPSPPAPDAAPARRGRRRVLFAAAVLLVVPLAAAAGLAVRLAMGPLDVTPLARLVLPARVLSGGAGRPPVLRLDVGQVRVGWDGLHRGLAAPLDVTATDLRLLRPDNVVADQIGAARLVLNADALWHGGIAPRMLVLSGARLALRRASDGSVGLDTGPFRAVATRGAAALALDIRFFDRLVVTDGAVTLGDQRTATSWRLDGLAADLRRLRIGLARGVTGTAAFGLSGPGLRARLRADGTRDGTALSWHVAGTPVAPRAFAPFLPQLAAIDLPLGFDATIRLAAGPHRLLARPRSAVLTLHGGAGQISTGPGPGSGPGSGSGPDPAPGTTGTIRFDDLQARLSADFGPRSSGLLPGSARIRLDMLQARLHPSDRPDAHPDVPAAADPVLQADGTLDVTGPTRPGLIHFGPARPGPPGTRLRASLHASLSDLDFARLGAFWPAGLAKGARAWVTRNITAGTAHGLHVAATLANDTGVNDAGWGGLRLRTLGGGVTGTGLDVHWLRPIAPMRGVDATLAIDGPDALSIRFSGGTQSVDRAGRNVDATGIGRIAIGNGSMRITGLLAKDQIGDIAATLHGDLPDIMALLAEPRLNLLSRHPLGFSGPSGRAQVALHLVLPLDDRVDIADIRLSSHADLAQVHLGNVVLNRALDDGALTLDATTRGLTLAGTAVLGGMPATLRYMMDFRKDAATSESAQVRAHLTPDVADRLGYAVGQRFAGSADLDVAYSRLADGTGQVALDLDLADAALTIPVWSKPRGQAAHASVRIGLAQGRLASVEAIHATGPDLQLDGRASVVDGQARTLVLRGFRIGRSHGDATIGLPRHATDPVRVAVQAPVLDLSPLLHPGPAPAAPKPGPSYHMPSAATGRVQGPPGRSWLIDADVPTLYYAPDGALAGVHAHVEDNGIRVTRLRFSMAGPSPATAILTPQPDGRHLRASVQDLGLMLQKLGVTQQFSGGATVLQGVFDDRQSAAPFAGSLTIGPIMLHDAPRPVRLANNASIYGWMQAPRGQGFEIRRVLLPLTFRDGTLAIHDGQAGNASLGVTVGGTIDLDRARLNLKGTIVPAFAVNALPGHMPGVGRLMSPEKGGGLLAATFSVGGALDRPDLHVNPFSIFLPGVMRRLVQ
ncbi:AsmA-like C-terminal region-containing protein [Nguyenibacter sp. L1]|uniref:AsmA-like C-terminal region-containing protein n=1 Tax=Nguyenibacter sp. L1 TaxID=3049350 RepID=UPI002B47741C|nr:AsmA-like C-terminal region-containing protein [Nguyenibacter sp. L1]WRH87484.1 AsmA-like C-terminal region-containing protein [Nguyenibacter sp. L1]